MLLSDIRTNDSITFAKSPLSDTAISRGSERICSNDRPENLGKNQYQPSQPTAYPTSLALFEYNVILSG